MRNHRDRPRGGQHSLGGVTPRAVLIGLLMVVVIVWMTQGLAIRTNLAEVGGDAPPPAPTYILFFYVLILLPLSLRFFPRTALSRGELLLIYTMMLVAGPITHPYCLGFIIPHAVSPLYYNAENPDWAVFARTLPSWMGPDTHSAVIGFFRGAHGKVPWGAWLLPAVAWCSLLIALFWAMLCIDTAVRRQWIEHERLPFPLAAIPLALTVRAAPSEAAQLFAHPIRLVRAPAFWLGSGAALALTAPHSLHRLAPTTPDLSLHNIQAADLSSLPPPWNGLGEINFSISFWLIGIVYLLPQDIALSAWAFYFVTLLENVAAVYWGHSQGAPDVYTNQFPALYAQGAGAAFGLTAIALYSARAELKRLFRAAWTGRPDADSPLSSRTTVLGAAAGLLFVLAWLCFAGMRLWVATVLLAMLLAYFFIFARIRAETGLAMGVILWPKMLDEMTLTFVGAKYLTLRDLTVLFSVRAIYFGSATGSVMACQLEGMKLADSGGLRGPRLGAAMAVTAAAAVLVAFAWTLKTYYTYGLEAMPPGTRESDMVGTEIWQSYASLVQAHGSAKGPDVGGILTVASGACIALGLTWMRFRIPGFPLHPVGFLAANSWGMQYSWASFFIGWLVTSLICRYGGLRTYRRLLPFFLGLILGDLLNQGLWGMVAWITGTRL